MPTLLDTLVAPPTGSANTASALSRREFLVEKAPKPVVGEVVHVYGPQGIASYRARVFRVSSDGIRVVGQRKEETLSPAEWAARVRPEDPTDFTLVPGFLRPSEPPPLPPALAKRQRAGRAVAGALVLSVPVVMGAAIGRYVTPELGPVRGAITGAGAVAGAVVATLAGAGAELTDLGGVLGSVATGTALGATMKATARGAALGATSGLLGILAAKGARYGVTRVRGTDARFDPSG